MGVPALASEVHGQGPRVVLVHGFTQTRRCWGFAPDDLALDHEVVLVDAPGHGDSATVPASIEEGAALLADVGGRATYVGYSMGGRYCLRLALERPDLVERLILIGATPGLASADERAARRRHDEELAERVEDIGVAAFVDEWLTLPLFAGLPGPMRCVAERRTNTIDGLAESLRRAGTGAMEPLWARLGELTMPVLLLVGEHDDKFTGIANQMVAELGGIARVEKIPGAGHCAHLEKPVSFLGAVRDWVEVSG